MRSASSNRFGNWESIMERDVLHLLRVPRFMAVMSCMSHSGSPCPSSTPLTSIHDLARHLAHTALLPVVLAGGQHRIGVAAKGQKVPVVHIHLFGQAPLQRAGRIAKDALQRRVAPDDDAV